MRDSIRAARILSAPERIGVDAEVIQRTLDGRLKISPDGTMRESNRYLLVGRQGAARPDPAQAAWLYAQMVRWGQTSVSPEALKVPTRSARSPDRRSMRTTLPAIWRRSRSDAKTPETPRGTKLGSWRNRLIIRLPA